MKRLTIAVLTAISISGCAFGAQKYNLQQETPSPAYQQYYSMHETPKTDVNTLKGRVVTVPAGQSFKAVMTTPVNTSTATAGQIVTMALGRDFYYNNSIVAPAGSCVNGTVIESSRAKHGSVNGKLTLRFTQIITPTGLNIPISAVVKTNDNTGTLIGGEQEDIKQDLSKEASIAAGLSASTLSTVPIRTMGQSASIVNAVGSGGGLAKSIWDKGADVDLPINTLLELVLIQPITVNPASFQD